MNALFNTIQALILYHRNIRKLTFFINGGGEIIQNITNLQPNI